MKTYKYLLDITTITLSLLLMSSFIGFEITFWLSIACIYYNTRVNGIFAKDIYGREVPSQREKEAHREDIM